MDCMKELRDKIQYAEYKYQEAVVALKDCNNRFSVIDRQLNMIRPKVLRLQKDKDQYTGWVYTLYSEVLRIWLFRFFLNAIIIYKFMHTKFLHYIIAVNLLIFYIIV